LIAVRSTKQAGVFLGKCLWTAEKTWLWTEKPEGTSSAIFGVGTAAKYCEIKRCADRIRSRTDKKDELVEGNLSNLNFFLPPKRQLSIF